MRLYMSPSDFAETAMGTYWTSVATSTQIARALANASRRVDSLVKYHLGLNGTTTLSDPATIGTTTLSVVSTLGLDAGGEAYIQLDAANTLETPNVTGVTVTAWTPPYPGTLTLATPLIASHLSGATVQGYTQERRTVRGRSSAQSDWDSALTQEAQMAIAHAPHDLGSDLVRVVFTQGVPLVGIVGVWVIQRWGAEVTPIPLQNVAINPSQGWYRLPLGAFVPPGADVQTAYTSGYGTVPEDVLDVVELLAADVLSRGDPAAARGYLSMKSEEQAVVRRAASSKDGKSVLRLEAEAALGAYIRLVP